jgi:hypothetical protein
MTLFATLASALEGWRRLLAGDPVWRDQFRLSGAGLGMALAILALAAFLAVAIASASFGMPGLIGILMSMIVLSLPLPALLVALLAARRMASDRRPLVEPLVPATYALVAFILVEGALALIAAPLAMLSWLLLGWLLYVLGRRAMAWNLAISASFAVLTIVLLVGMRLALYMLTSPAAGSPI